MQLTPVPVGKVYCMHGQNNFNTSGLVMLHRTLRVPRPYLSYIAYVS